MLQTEKASSSYICACEAKGRRSRRWMLAFEEKNNNKKKVQGCWKRQGNTVIAEVAKAFASSSETKELRVSCLSAMWGSPVDNKLSVNIGRGCCYLTAIHLGIFLRGGKTGGLDGKRIDMLELPSQLVQRGMSVSHSIRRKGCSFLPLLPSDLLLV